MLELLACMGAPTESVGSRQELEQKLHAIVRAVSCEWLDLRRGKLESLRAVMSLICKVRGVRSCEQLGE